MAEMPFMPVKVTDILADAGDLPNELFGAYTRLLFRWWAEGALPEPNEKKLARWAGLSSADFEDLKEFLLETEKGWVQKRLMRTYAEQLEKSLKGRKSANARHGKCERNADVDKDIANGYADRMLSMKHEAGKNVDANASTDQKKKNKKRKGENGAAPAPNDFPMPTDSEARRVIERIAAKPNGKARLCSYLIYDGRCALEHYSGDFLIAAPTAIIADMIDQRLGGELNEIIGRGKWKTAVRPLAA